jgi:hypothetical protein
MLCCSAFVALCETSLELCGIAKRARYSTKLHREN